MIFLRNILFYPAFYLGSVFFVLASVVSIPIGPAPLRWSVAAWSRFHRTCLRWLLGIKIEVEGQLSREPVFYAVRHESFFEAIDAPAMYDTPVTFAKHELSIIPGWGRAAKAYGMIFVERDQGAKALRKMVSAAREYSQEGRPLVIYPEGTRTPHGEAGKLQAGFAGLYKLIGLPVVPVAVNSGPMYHRFWKRPGTITYRIGETIPPGLPRAEIEARVIAAINALN
ncbi:lysophospholipid acyltransferase family protein [Allopontixanthobacter sediminis]|uniref:1-acyl-sn-glycerol-3-phosphate acyltransferase n=1 Tax=Allopontixanthobacter sediminis TaxID=1689985 RepID=A0A845B8G7_9SPHN|nr:lysophospholipid acyltransferase family protein [Allopontixanthobacter sediminis]MXP45717.1 1-acyl-sn-glycerol-3-phosphate acyltransferase [Allopontixanthobacter sediminis]